MVRIGQNGEKWSNWWDMGKMVRIGQCGKIWFEWWKHVKNGGITNWGLAVASLGSAVLAGLVDIWVKMVTIGYKSQNMVRFKILQQKSKQLLFLLDKQTGKHLSQNGDNWLKESKHG